MKKIIMAAIAVASATAAYAYTETFETMVVETATGNVEIRVDDIMKVSFGTKTVTTALEITRPGEEAESWNNIESALRVIPQENGARTEFALGTGSGVEAAELRLNSKYVAYITVSALSLYQGETDLSEGAASVTLYRYDNEAVVETLTDPTGKLTTSRDTRGAVTLLFDGEFADGTTISIDFKGRVTDVTSLAELNPAPKYDNGLYYFNADGDLSFESQVTSVTRTTRSNGMYRYTITTEKEGQTCYIEMKPSIVGDCVEFTEVENNSLNFTYGSIQVSGPNDQYRNTAKNGTLCLEEGADGTITIMLDITNRYTTTFGGDGGTPERIIIDCTAPLTVN